MVLNGIPLHGLTVDEFHKLEPCIRNYHTYESLPNTCSALVTRRIEAPVSVVWPIVRCFEKPQTYKRFIKSCTLRAGDGGLGSIRECITVSGIPSTTSMERLEILDDEKHILSFRIVGGEHRLHNYRSVISLDEFISKENGKVYTIVLESYIVDIPEGNTSEDTILFTETILKMNHKSLAAVAMASLEGITHNRLITEE